MRRVQIVSRPRTVKMYRSVLETDWEEGSTSSALGLVRRVLADSGCNVEFVWESQSGKGRYLITENTFEELRNFTFLFRYDKTWNDLPLLPNRRSEQAIRLAQAALEASMLLNFQHMAKITWEILIEDEDEFLRSCQSLLFTLAIYDLLPRLRSRRLNKEHQILLDALDMHVTLIWQDSPAHHAHLTGLLGSYIEDEELSRKALELSFSATRPEDHDYLTRAHTLWYRYLDSEDFESAKAFVLSLHRTAPSDSISEITEMIEDTYSFFNRRKASKSE